MTIESEKEERLRWLTKDVTEFELASESWEPGDSKSGDNRCMGVFDPARYAKQVRFINKNQDTKIRVVAMAQKDTKRLRNLRVAVNAQGPEVGGVGVDVGWKYLPSETIPSTEISKVLAAGADPKNPGPKNQGEWRTDVPKGAEGLYYTWHALVGSVWVLAGQGFVQKKRNVVFEGIGDAEAAKEAAAKPRDEQ